MPPARSGTTKGDLREMEKVREMEAITAAMGSAGGQIILRELEDLYWRAFQNIRNEPAVNGENITYYKSEMNVIEKLLSVLGSKIDFGESAKSKLRKKLYKE